MKARQGRRIHAMTLHVRRSTTACGRRMKGWVVALGELDCPNCMLAVGWDCRPPKKRKKHRASARRRR